MVGWVQLETFRLLKQMCFLIISLLLSCQDYAYINFSLYQIFSCRLLIAILGKITASATELSNR